MAATKPLSHITVLDFSAVFAGPICARLMSDCGADVIKVETIGMGDMTRGPKGNSRVFAHFNAGKRSIALDLKQPRAQQIVQQLLSKADVVLENFRPGVMQQFGLDYASIKASHPAIVYCSISGFGQSGPMAQRAAYAPIAHAASGFDSVHSRSQPEPEAPPAVSSIMIADILTGSYAFGAIQTALLGRTQTGMGDHIDASMLESMISLIPGQVQIAQIPDAPQPTGFHPIRTRDGHIMICVLSGKNLRSLCKAMAREDLLEDERFAKGQHLRNQPALRAEVEAWSAALDADHCETVLSQAGVPCSRYNAPEALFDHPQLLDRAAFTQQHDEYGDFLIQNAPFQFANVDIATASSSPALGQHTDTILSQLLGYSPDDIQALRDAGTVG